MGNVIIERAHLRDWLAIAELDRTEWGANRHSQFIPDGEHVWRLWVEYATVLVARHPNVGVVGAVLTFPTNHKQLHYLHKILVHREHRGGGVGKLLMEAISRCADQQGWWLRLSTDTNNKAIQKLCAACGFTEVGLEKGYYRAHEDRLIYTRPPQTL